MTAVPVLLQYKLLSCIQPWPYYRLKDLMNRLANQRIKIYLEVASRNHLIGKFYLC